MNLSTLTIPPDSTFEILFYRIEAQYRSITVSRADGWVDILKNIMGEWIVVNRIPPEHSNYLLVSNVPIRIRTNGNVEASVQLLSGEQYVDITE